MKGLTLSLLLGIPLLFAAWVVVQLNASAGALLFITAFTLPLILMRKYFHEKPRRAALFVSIMVVLTLLFRPPPVFGPNIYFGLHFATGCWEREGDTWPLSEGELTYSCNEIAAYSTVRVSGVAWKSVSVELPLLGGFVTLYEPRGKAEKAYREATERLESKDYIKLVENYGTYSHTIKDALFVKGSECVYLMETSVLGGGLAVISARGPCRGVKGYALRWHDDYLWNASEPPIFKEYRFNWSSKEGVKLGRFTPVEWPEEWVRNTYDAICIELKGTGYVKRMEGKTGDCRWSIWTTGGKSHYLAIKGKEILVLSGKTEDVERTAEKVLPCGLRNGWKAKGKTPGEVLNAVIGELSGSSALKPAGEPALWAFAGEKLVGENLSVTVLVYGTQWQCDYARYLLDTGENTTSICIGRGGYFVTVAIEGDAKSVSVVLSSIKQPKRT